MSQNLYRLTNRTPVVDARGMPTPEFLRWAEALFARAGGFEGFSNQELFGEVASPDYRDEMLERIAALEAQLRGTIQQAQQVMQITMEVAQERSQVQAGITQDSLVVKGSAHLNSINGRTLIGNPVDDGDTRLQVDGNIRADNISAGGDVITNGLDVVADADVGGDLGVTGAATVGALSVMGMMQVAHMDTDTGYSVDGDAVVGPRITGWGAPTGASDRATYAAFPGLTVGATYDPAQLQALADALQEASARLVALIQDARTHGLIGD